MLKMNIASLFVFLFCAVLSAGDAVEQALAERSKLLEQAKEDYEKKILEINALTIEKLSIVLKRSIASKKFKEAEAAGNAISKLQKPVKIDDFQTKAEAPEQAKEINSIANASTDGDFPEGTFRKYGHHYKILPLKMTYADAAKTCESFGGHLLSISNDTEYEFFFDMAVKEKKQIWLDLHREKGEGDWLLWNGEKASRFKWFAGKYNEDKNSDAVVINVNNSGADMIRVKGSKFACFVICEWEK